MEAIPKLLLMPHPSAVEASAKAGHLKFPQGDSSATWWQAEPLGALAPGGGVILPYQYWYLSQIRVCFPCFSCTCKNYQLRLTKMPDLAPRTPHHLRPKNPFEGSAGNNQHTIKEPAGFTKYLIAQRQLAKCNVRVICQRLSKTSGREGHPEVLSRDLLRSFM